MKNYQHKKFVKAKRETSKWLVCNEHSFFLILILSFVLYGNSIFNKYNMDDEFVVRNNVQVEKGIKAIPQILTSRYFENSNAKFGYRPITKVVFAIEVSLFGVNPHISHLINVLLFAIMVFVTLLLLRRIFNDAGVLFIWAVLLLWMFHPIHTEVVASLKNREEILYFLLAVLSTLCFLSYIDTGKILKLIYAFILFCVSFLTKQSAISFALIIPVIFVFKYTDITSWKDIVSLKKWMNDDLRKRIILSLTVLWITTFVMYKLPLWLFPPDKLDMFSFENPLRYNHKWVSRFSVAALTLLYYLKLLFYPHPLLFYYGLYTIPDVNITDFVVWFSVTIHLVILYLLFRFWKNNKFFVFGVLIYYAGISPFSNYFMEINGIVAERLLHGPSIGFAIAIVAMIFYVAKIPFNIQSIKQIKTKWIICFFGILILYTFKTISRNRDWKDNMTLFSHDIRYLDNSVKANDIIAQTIMDRVIANNPFQHPIHELKPSLDSVIFFYNRSLSFFPDNAIVLNNVANIYINFYNQPEKALGYLQKGYKIKPNIFELNFNFGECYEMLKNDSLSIRYYTKALLLKNNYPKLWQSIINAYFNLNMPDSAKFYAEKMLKIDTISDIPYVSIGYYYLLKKDTAMAANNWEKAFKRNPTNYDRAIILGNYFAQKRDS
ncbi:MAG: hypothetical protein A2X08_00660, partial [Bacteroidetes bacterium GWA2_32_17]